MKKIKRKWLRRVKRKKHPKKPTKVIMTDGTEIIVPRQSKFGKGWLHDHGCPIVSAYMALQFCGVKKVGKKKLGIKILLKWWLAHFPERFRATLTSRGLYLGLKSLLKDVAHVKRFPPNAITTKRVRTYLNAGCFIIMHRRRPHGNHYYPIISDYAKDGKRHTFILNAGKCKQTTAAKQVSDKSNSPHYGGMIVITRKKKK